VLVNYLRQARGGVCWRAPVSEGGGALEFVFWLAGPGPRSNHRPHVHQPGNVGAGAADACWKL